MAYPSFFLFILIAIAIFELNQPTLAKAHQKRNNTNTNTNDIGIYPKVAVQICNKLPGILQTHCISGKDDFGLHTVASGSCETWNFRPNVMGTTVYICALRCDRGTLRLNIYDFKRDSSQRCVTNCHWDVLDDDVHGITQKGAEDIFYAFFK